MKQFGNRAFAITLTGGLLLTGLTACNPNWEALENAGQSNLPSTSSAVTISDEVSSEAISSEATLSSAVTSSEAVSSKKSEQSSAVNSCGSTAQGEKHYLVLINPTHPVAEITRDNLVKLTVNQKSNGNGKYFDKAGAPYVEQMFADAKKEGIDLLSRSTFRTYQLQKTYFDSSYNDYLRQGLSSAEAKRRALEYTAYPGTSEHHTGLAIDITTTAWESSGKGLLDTFADTEAGKWLAANAYKYGFILRYPKNKEAITKIKFEPWHFRFVGVEAATEIYNRGICLEEYLGILD